MKDIEVCVTALEEHVKVFPQFISLGPHIPMINTYNHPSELQYKGTEF